MNQIIQSKYLLCYSETCKRKHFQPVAPLQQPCILLFICFSVLYFLSEQGGSVSPLILSQINLDLFTCVAEKLEQSFNKQLESVSHF